MQTPKIVQMKVSDIIPYENNPRRNDEAVEFVASSIKEFGFKNPIILTKDNVIVAGHTRWKAAIQLGLEEAPCIIADDLTEEQIQAFRLADNKTAEVADWNFFKLANEIGGLEDFDFDMEQFGFDDSEMQSLMGLAANLEERYAELDATMEEDTEWKSEEQHEGVFRPNYTPQSSERVVTDEDIKTAAQRQIEYVKKAASVTMRTMICPHCGK